MKKTKRWIALLLSAAMLLTAAGVGQYLPVRVKAAANALESLPEFYKTGEFFSTDNVWYDAVTKNGSGLQWQAGNTIAYDAGFGGAQFNQTYVKIANADLLAGVSASTGVTFAYTMKSNEADNHRHVLSLGRNEYTNSKNEANHLYVSATSTWMSGGKFPVVGYHNGSGETINAFPNGGPSIEANRSYDITVTISVSGGVQFTIDGVSYSASYYNSSYSNERGNIEAALNALGGFRQNYIGASRWQDPKFNGYVKNLCIYRKAFTASQLETQTLESSAFTNAAVSGFSETALYSASTSFNGKVYHYRDDAVGGYSNVVYAAPAGTTPGIRGADNSEDYKDIEGVYLKFFTPLPVVMVYDGVHDVCAPIELEFKRHNRTNVQDQRVYYATTDNGNFGLKQAWYGYLDAAWTTWAGSYTSNRLRSENDGVDNYVNATNDTPRFWWNALKFRGDFNDGTFFKQEHDVVMTIEAFFDYTIGGTSKGTGNITTRSDYYVINYKPVYDILTSSSAATVGSYAWYTANVKGQEWKYTEASLNQCLRALYLLQEANPNRYTYAGREALDVADCAAAIRLAMQEVAKINLVKKTGTYNFVIDGVSAASATINYGDSYAAAVPTDALPADTNLTTYTFSGWQKSIQPQHGDYIMDGDVTYTADLVASDNLFVYRNGSSSLQNIASKYGSITSIEGSDAFTLADGKLSFHQDTPTSTEFVTASISGRRQKIYVVSSPVVCYDDADSIFTYADGAADAWEVSEGDFSSPLLTSEDDFVFGSGIDGAAERIGGGAHTATVTQGSPSPKLTPGAENYDNVPHVTFTFSGTAFEVISEISDESAVVCYTIEDSHGNKETRIVDTFYGYTYNETDDTWEYTGDTDAGLKRIPVIRKEFDAYDTYTVTVAAAYNRAFARAHGSKPSYTFTFDGVKIYDPLNKINAGAGDLVYDAYNKIGQAGYTETVLRAALDANAAVIGDSALNSIFIGPNAQTVSYAEMKAVCPTNEIWLTAGSSISLRLNAQSALLSFACVDGTTNVSIDGQTYAVGYGTVYLPVPVNTAEVVTIQNTGNCLLSLRNLRYIPNSSQALFRPLTLQEVEQHLVHLAKTQEEAEQVQTPDTPQFPQFGNGRRLLSLQALIEMIFGRFFEALRLIFIRK